MRWTPYRRAMLHLVCIAVFVACGQSQKPQPLQVAQDPPSQTDALVITFAEGDPQSHLSPRYSPPGKGVALEPSDRRPMPGFDHLEGRLELGAGTGSGYLLVLARSTEAKPYDRLVFDADGDGDLDDEEVHSGRPSRSKRGTWSNFDASARVVYDSGEPLEHPLHLWILVREENDTPERILCQVSGFRAGRVEIEGVKHDVVISDAHNDAMFGNGDYWALRPVTQTTNLRAEESRRVGDFAWASGRAWTLRLDRADGRRGRLMEHETDLTQEEDEISRDRYRVDREAARAEVALSFRTDAEAAIAEARGRGVPYFLDFWTDWCGPCKSMDRLVFTARSVVQAAEGLVLVKIDGDARPDLAERYGVRGYPTGILFGADGGEVDRFVGYRGVKAMTAFFEQR